MGKEGESGEGGGGWGDRGEERVQITMAFALLHSYLYLSPLAHGGRVQSLSPGDRGGQVASFVQKLWLNHNQSYGFSNSHVWMCKLEHKESWALKNWCFWTVMLEKTLEESLGLQGDPVVSFQLPTPWPLLCQHKNSKSKQNHPFGLNASSPSCLTALHPGPHSRS